MSDAADATTASDPPMEKARGDARLPGVGRLFAGLTIAPFAWALHVLVGYGVAAYACYPTDAALPEPLFAHLRAFVVAVTVAMWMLLAAGCWIAWRNWTATRGEPGAHPHRVLQSGEGRSRFMALCGVLVSGLFAIALAFTSAGIWIPGCGP